MELSKEVIEYVTETQKLIANIEECMINSCLLPICEDDIRKSIERCNKSYGNITYSHIKDQINN